MLTPIDFAQALQDVQFLGLKELRLRLHHDGPYNPDFEPPSALRGLVPTNDYLSLAINQISQNLTTLKLTEPSIISPSLFCMQGGSKPHWPHLKHIRVDFHEITPEGEWRYNFNDFDDDGESLSHWSSDATWSDASDISTLDEPIFNGSLEWHDALRFAGACGDNPREAARKSTTPDMLSEMFIAAARASSAMPALQTMDIRSYRSSRPRASNRMIFLESSTYWRMLDLEYGEDEHHYKLDGKAASGPCVTWIRRRYDPKPVNEVWREVKGNRIRLSRIHLAQFPRSIKPWHNSDDDEDSESDESDPWDRYDYLQEMEEDMVFAYWDDL